VSLDSSRSIATSMMCCESAENVVDLILSFLNNICLVTSGADARSSCRASTPIVVIQLPGIPIKALYRERCCDLVESAPQMQTLCWWLTRAVQNDKAALDRSHPCRAITLENTRSNLWRKRLLGTESRSTLRDGVGAASVLLVQPLASAMHLPFTAL